MIVPDSERTAMEYDAMGADYEAANKEGSFNAYYERPATIDLIGDPDRLRVLEAGCGPGLLTEWLTRHGAAVTAFDIGPEMVRLARTRCAGRLLRHQASHRDLGADRREPPGHAVETPSHGHNPAISDAGFLIDRLTEPSTSLSRTSPSAGPKSIAGSPPPPTSCSSAWSSALFHNARPGR
jgi:SAM-dependent methyltransferase